MMHESSHSGDSVRRADRGVIGLVAVVLASIAVASCDRFSGPEARIERAQTQLEAGHYAEAMSDVKAVLEADPENAEGRILLARISLRAGDAESARKELDRALDAGAEPASVLNLHYQILGAQRRFEDMLIAASADDDLADLDRVIFTATALTALGRHDEAERSVDSALALSPEDPEVLIIRARSLAARGMGEQAAEVLEGVLKAHPDMAEAWLLRGSIAMSLGEMEGARAAFENAREHARTQLNLPDQLLLAAGLVECNLALGDLSRAEGELKAMEAFAPAAMPTRYLRARLAYVRKEFPVAAAELQRALTEFPDHVPSRLLLGAALLEQGNLEQAASELSPLVAEHPENFAARKLLARVYLTRNDPASAQRVLQEAPIGAERTGELEQLLSSVQLQAGQTSEAIARLERSAAADPDNMRVRLDLARAYLLAAEREKALEILNSVPADVGGDDRRQLLILVEVLGRPTAEVISGLEGLIAQYPDDAALLRMAGEQLLAEGYVSKARAAIERAVALDPTDVSGLLSFSRALFLQGEADAAASQLKRALEIDPANEWAQVGLAEMAARRGARQEARDLLERAISTNPGAVLPRLRLAQFALEDHDDERARALLEQTLIVAQRDVDTLNQVGEVWLRGLKYEDALAVFNQAAAAGSTQAHYLAARALVSLDRLDESKQRLQVAIKANPKWDAPVALLATIEAREGKTEQALKRVQALRAAGGSTVAADGIEGDVWQMGGRYDEAVKAYERAAAVRPTAALAIRIYQARRAAGVASPEAGLVNWLETWPDDQTVHMVLAEYYQSVGAQQDAIAHYEILVNDARVRASPFVLNNLAWLYYQTGDERAEALARRAYENGKGAPEIADTYGWILVQKGRTDEGLKLLEEAVSQAPQHPEILYHRAAALAKAGRMQDASAALRALLESAPSFPSRDEAQALLASLKP